MESLEKELHNSLRQWHLEKRGEKELSLSGDFLFAPSFSGFNGHFPEQPILPAIVQLAAVRHLAELAAGVKLLPSGCRNVKFRAAVLPEDNLHAAVTLKRLERGWRAEFSLQRSGETVSDGILDFSS